MWYCHQCRYRYQSKYMKCYPFHVISSVQLQPSPWQLLWRWGFIFEKLPNSMWRSFSKRFAHYLKLLVSLVCCGRRNGRKWLVGIDQRFKDTVAFESNKKQNLTNSNKCELETRLWRRPTKLNHHVQKQVLKRSGVNSVCEWVQTMLKGRPGRRLVQTLPNF